MRFQRILLVSPPSSSYLGAARPPQNLGYLAKALLENRIDYDIMDMRLGYRIEHLFEKIKNFRPDLIGVSMVSLEYRNTNNLISKVKAYDSRVPIVVGGPHVTVLQEKVQQENKDIDFSAVYESEETLVELCQDRIPISEIKGLIFKHNDEIIYNGPRSYPQNLDQISFPTYEKFELHKYIQEMPFNSSRGCPFQCIFCPNKMITKKFRWRSARNVVDEIEYWYSRGFRIFNYDDDNFSFLKDRVYEICDEIERRNLLDAEYRCSNGLRADRIDQDLLKRMREVGFNYIAFGIDGGNDRILKLNKKGETLQQIENAIRTSCDLGFDVKIFCITGMPYETLEDIEDSLRLVQKYPVRRVILNNPIPYPGTELFEIIKKNQWFIKEPEEYLNTVTENENSPVFETPELSMEKRIQILKRCRKIEKKVTQNGIRKMYQKYGILASAAGMIFSCRFTEQLFFKNRRFRKIMEKIRYHRTMANRKRK